MRAIDFTELGRAAALAACTHRAMAAGKPTTRYEWAGVRRGLLLAWYGYWHRAIPGQWFAGGAR